MGVNMETARFFKQDFEVKYLLFKLVVCNARTLIPIFEHSRKMVLWKMFVCF